MKHIEDLNQIFICSFLKKLQSTEDFIFYSIPNGGSRDKREASRLKMTGLTAGIPDLQFIRHGKTFFIELKTNSGDTHKAQDDMIAELTKHGINTYIIHGDTPQETLPQVANCLHKEFGFNQNGMSKYSTSVLESSFADKLFKATGSKS